MGNHTHWVPCADAHVIGAFDYVRREALLIGEIQFILGWPY